MAFGHIYVRQVVPAIREGKTGYRGRGDGLSDHFGREARGAGFSEAPVPGSDFGNRLPVRGEQVRRAS